MIIWILTLDGMKGCKKSMTRTRRSAFLRQAVLNNQIFGKVGRRAGRSEDVHHGETLFIRLRQIWGPFYWSARVLKILAQNCFDLPHSSIIPLWRIWGHKCIYPTRNILTTKVHKLTYFGMRIYFWMLNNYLDPKLLIYTKMIWKMFFSIYFWGILRNSHVNS